MGKAVRSLQAQVLAECQAMARYAFTTGLKVPGPLFEKLENLAAQITRRQVSRDGEVVTVDNDMSDVDDMPTVGIVIATSKTTGAVGRQLAQVHARLADLVAPARPRTILLLAEEKEKANPFYFLGEVPLIRRLMFISIISLIGLISVSLSSAVDGNPKSFSLLENQGTSLLLNQLFLLTAASLGASFANLIQTQRYIKDGTFDPKYESSYWVRYVLGLMAGLILAVLVPVDELLGGAAAALPIDPDAGDAAGPGGVLQGLGKPTLAMFGGYSSAMVYRVLNKIIAAFESIVKGDAEAAVAARENEARARLAHQAIENRVGLAAQLSELQMKLGDSPDPETLRRELELYQRRILDPDGFEETEEGDAEKRLG